jgi:hypothetical protein
MIPCRIRTCIHCRRPEGASSRLRFPYDIAKGVRDDNEQATCIPTLCTSVSKVSGRSKFEVRSILFYMSVKDSTVNVCQPYYAWPDGLCVISAIPPDSAPCCA